MSSDPGQLLDDFIACRYKAELTLKNERVPLTEGHRLRKRQRVVHHQKVIAALTAGLDSTEILRAPVSLSRSIRERHKLVLDSKCHFLNGEIHLPPVEPDLRRGKVQTVMPVLCSPSNKAVTADKLIACVYALIIDENTSLSVERAKIVYGDAYNVCHTALFGKNGATQLARRARQLLDEFSTFLAEGSPRPALELNSHCEWCEFKHRCAEEARLKDDISLLSGMSHDEVSQWREKGIQTVAQLAYMFQPRRYCRPNYDPKKHSQPLQALAVQQRTIFVRKPISGLDAAVRVYLDVEGVPDDDRYYLIGMIRVDSEGQDVHQFWADSRDAEREMWYSFVQKFSAIAADDLIVFHYGKYEPTFVQVMMNRYGNFGSERVERLAESMCDVHSRIRTNVFFPAYSNRLKDIAGSLGFRWAGPITTGVESLVWRREWESTRDDELKDELLQYNREDCQALQTVVQSLRSLQGETQQSERKVACASELNPPSSYGFGESSNSNPELSSITKRAYFNYQRERIFVRTNPGVRRSLKRKMNKMKSSRKHRINSEVVCAAPETCPDCGCNIMRLRSDAYSKRVNDLKFTASGIKRWVTLFKTRRFQCGNCGKTACSPDYPKKQRYYGHGLASWIVHQHVANRQPHQAIVDNLHDLFGLKFATHIVESAKLELAARYHETEQLLVSALCKQEVVCIDETKIRVRGGIGYVWAFSGLGEVVYRFTETRDATILQDVLDGFEGVVVSDFYSAYDSTPCAQQKCLVHLIRDINDDLLKAPFNDELKTLANRFTKLLKAIVDEVDKFGLKQRHLNKFVKPASRFQDWVMAQNFRTKPAQRYQKRIRKYGARLFTFLQHDGIPWNNNIAENAIKLVVSRRRFFGASYSKEGMRDYLRFLSFYQTLRHEGGSLLRFLLSKETNLLTFMGE